MSRPHIPSMKPAEVKEFALKLEKENAELRHKMAGLENELKKNELSVLAQEIRENFDSVHARLIRLEDAAFTKLPSENEPPCTPTRADSSWAAVVGRGVRARNLNVGPGPIPTSNRFELLQAYQDLQTLDDRKRNAMIIGLPENSDSCEESDCSVVRTILDSAGISQQKFTRAVRKGKPNAKKQRPVKVEFDSEATRNQFLIEFRKNRPQNLAVGGHCRRDMTATELVQDKVCQQECIRRNKAEGKRRWIVRDLKIIEAKKPWPILANRDLKNSVAGTALAQQIQAEATKEQGDVQVSCHKMDTTKAPLVSPSERRKRKRRLKRLVKEKELEKEFVVVDRDPDRAQDRSEKNRDLLVEQFLASLHPSGKTWWETENHMKELNEKIFDYHLGEWNPLIGQTEKWIFRADPMSSTEQSSDSD